MGSEVRRVHMTKTQLKAGMVDAQEMVCILGRGSGKSSKVIAPRARRCVFTMPRSVGAFYAGSFQQLLTKTLPPVLAGWSDEGLQQGRDYVFGERPPSWWDKPRQPPLNFTRTFSFRNGSAIILASQETRGSLNGPSIDWMIGDEAKFIKQERFEGEAVQAMRGNLQHYSHTSLHHSLMLCSDMPIASSGRWLLDKEKDMDNEAVELIMAYQSDIFHLRQAIAGGLAASTVKNYQQRIARIQANINELRKGTLYYLEGSALDNVDALGLSYIARMRKILPAFLFDVTILNKRPDRVEGGFYPGLDASTHTYIAPTTAYAESRGFLKEEEKPDCRYDATLVDSLPIDIACDYGTTLNCMVVGQLFDTRYNVDNCFYTKAKIRDLVKDFDEYYRPRKCKDINYWFDHTATAESPILDYSFSDEVTKQLSARGWNVNRQHMGQAPGHHDKYVFMGRVFARDEGLPELWINAENCEPLLLSLQLAPARQTRKGFEKDKTSERDPNADQAEATHLSDAFDQLIWAVFNGLNVAAGSGGAMFG